ncbi:MAG: phospholipase [Gemmatimonadetes bacterium]|nr:phospholipase [Gemmatimonadota bacterium]
MRSKSDWQSGVMTLSRREFLERVALAAGAGWLGCSASTESSALPAPGRSGLEHVVVVTMENRSYDHLLGWVPGADGRQAGLTYLDAAGTAHATHHLTDFQGCGFADPSHSFAGGRVEYNNGACDGWLRADANDPYAIGYYEGADLPFLGGAAPHWTVLDRYFSPMLGPTYPNRIVAQAGQTDRISNTPVASTLPTIWDRLSSGGLTGRNYGAAFVTASLFGNRYASVIRPMSAFFADAAAGALPNVAYLDPDFRTAYTGNYHPFDDIRNGEAFLAATYQALISSPAWASTLLIITFDEWGGFYDHVPPPVAPIPPLEREVGNTDGLRGFRVPTLVISPLARRGHVSSVVYDHASILRLIEWRWSLEPLTVRDANANNLAEVLDFSAPLATAPVFDLPSGPFGGPCP